MTKIAKVRFSNRVVAFDNDRIPVVHRFNNVEQGLTIEVRRLDNQVFVYGALDCSGVIRYAGNFAGQWAHSDAELYNVVSVEMFRLAAELGLEPQHVWPFVEQLPVFTDEGVNVAEAAMLEVPIKDLLARGALPLEVMTTLHVEKEMIEFVLGTILPPPRQISDPFEPSHDDESNW